MPQIEIKNLDYTYLPDSTYEHDALKEVTFSLKQGEFLGVFGTNGSGKSTLAMLLNGLLCPTRGMVNVCGVDTADKKLRRDLWKKVSLVFQYPEQQIFQTTVFDEIAYGPRNLGIAETEIKDRVYAAMLQVGLIPEKTMQSTPYSLSGGMRRRVAVAGLLAMNPEILIMDEPMAGLDKNGRQMILDIIKNRQKDNQTTVMISHNLKEIIGIADKIAVLDKGTLAFFGNVQDLLAKQDLLAHYHFELPEYLQVMYALSANGFDVKTNIRSIQEAGSEISRLLQD